MSKAGFKAALFIAFLALPLHADHVAPDCRVDLHSGSPAQLKPIEDDAASQLRRIWPSAPEQVIQQAAGEFAHGVVEGRKSRPGWLKQQDQNFDPHWHFKAVEYMFYADKLIGPDGKPSTFDDLTELLPYFKSRGVNLLYALPFLKSPQKDAGFDVSDYMKVAPELGGNPAFKRFIAAAKALDIKIKMDLILNHISDEHPWFQAFLKGDMSYKDFFHVLDHPPDIVSKVSDHRGRVITYRERNARGEWVNIERRVMFPEISDTHYREVEIPQKDGSKKKFWVFYTFYPFQIDLNWEKPAVLQAFYRIVNYWVNAGVDVFRFDAVPFLNKSQESHPQTHLIVQLFNSYLRQVSPNTLIMPEACQPADVIADYFGKSENVPNHFVGRNLPTTSESQLVYDFERKQYALVSLVTGLKKYVVGADARKPPAPANALYALPVSVHDENTMEMVTDVEARAQVVATVTAQGGGEIFREGLGVSGRPANLYGKDPRRILMAHALTWSGKGMPIIYYGDDIMALNDHEHAVKESERLAVQMKAAGIQAKSSYDSRHIVRKPVARSRFLNLDPQSPEAMVNYGMSHLIRTRMSDQALIFGEERPVENDNAHVYTMERATASDSTLVVINLSGRRQTVRIRRIAFTARDLLTSSNVSLGLEEGWITMTLEPYAYHWLKTR